MTRKLDRWVDPRLVASVPEVEAQQTRQATEAREGMPWFILQSERKTWTKFLVQAEDSNAAILASDNWEYFGYVDGEDTESEVVGGPFSSRDEALDDGVAWVDG